MSEVSFNFQGKKAIVTGASRGIGRDIVRALAEAKCSKIYGIARDKNKLEELKQTFPSVEVVAVDLSDWKATRTAVDAIEPVNFLINNAAIFLQSDLVDMKPEQVDESFNVNVKSVLNISQIVCSKMAKGSAVVNISSSASLYPVPTDLVYGASKCALDGITKHMAMELAPRIRVNSVHPTVVMTDMTREVYTGEKAERKKKTLLMGRFAELEEVSKATLFLLSGAAGMTTGHGYPVNGGMKASPWAT